MRREERKYAYVDLFPDEPGPRMTPMHVRGAGMYFVYLTNRNHCTFLFKPRPYDRALDELLCRTFPMGYAQLYLLEKVNNVASGREEPGKGFCVFQDPEWTHVGSGAVGERFPNKHDAVEAMKLIRGRGGPPVIVVRMLEDLTWH